MGSEPSVKSPPSQCGVLLQSAECDSVPVWIAVGIQVKAPGPPKPDLGCRGSRLARGPLWDFHSLDDEASFFVVCIGLSVESLEYLGIQVHEP